MRKIFYFTLLSMTTACSTYRPGPDKQVSHQVVGAMTGAGSGAIAGFQLGAGTGPGALVGAGVGAVAGGVRGFAHDVQEAELDKVRLEIEQERARLEAHELIASFYQKRLVYHPTRDIYPADVFFNADSASLCHLGKQIVEELAKLTSNRLPWSRFSVIVYVKAKDPKSDYATYLSEKRALALANHFIREGIEPRRLEVRGVITKSPIVQLENDAPDRYAQAVEFIPLDR